MRAFTLTVLVLAIIACAKAETAPATQPAQAIPDRRELEKRFELAMTNATLVGYYSIDGQTDAQPGEDRYVIQRASKVAAPSAGKENDLWLLVWRARVGGRDISIPLVIPVKWAGDTPVLSVTDLPIPGMGTYTARVVIYRDSYAGTWSDRTHRGHLWGRIERTAASQPATQPLP